MKRSAPLRRATPKARAFADKRGAALSRKGANSLRRGKWSRRPRTAAQRLRRQLRHVKQFGVAYRLLIQSLPCAAENPAMYRTGAAVRRTVQAFRHRVLSEGTPVSEPAHVKTRGAGGRAVDMVPLSHAAHVHQHEHGIKSFQDALGLDLREVARAIAATPFASACQNIDARIYRALRLTVKQTAPGEYHVTGGRNPDGQWVNRHEGFPRCSCEDYLGRRERTCKHRIAVRLHHGQSLEQVARAVLQEEVFDAANAGRAPTSAARRPVTRAQASSEMDAIFGVDGEERAVCGARPIGMPRDVLARDEERLRAAAESARAWRAGREAAAQAYTRPELVR
jgi:hypothetical protein